MSFKVMDATPQGVVLLDNSIKDKWGAGLRIRLDFINAGADAYCVGDEVELTCRLVRRADVPNQG